MPGKTAIKLKKKAKLRHNEYYNMQEIFDALYDSSCNNKVFKNLIDIIKSEENILLAYRNIKKNRGNDTSQNIQKQVVKVQKLHQRLVNIRTDYINKMVSQIIKQKSSYIIIEDLAVSNLMKNKHLSKAITSQKFFEFKTKLVSKYKKNNV